MSDNISREITKDEAIKILESMSDISTQGEAIDMAIEALSSQNLTEPNNTCEVDLISRADAIEAVESVNKYYSNEKLGYVHGLIKNRLKELPSAEAVQGEWIEVEVLPEVYDIEGVKTWGSEMQCDQCGFRHTAIEGHMAQYNFCPNCGAKMKGGDDE